MSISMNCPLDYSFLILLIIHVSVPNSFTLNDTLYYSGFTALFGLILIRETFQKEAAT